MNARRLKQEFRAIALKKQPREKRFEAMFRLDEIIQIIEFYEDLSRQNLEKRNQVLKRLRIIKKNKANTNAFGHQPGLFQA